MFNIILKTRTMPFILPKCVYTSAGSIFVSSVSSQILIFNWQVVYSLKCLFWQSEHLRCSAVPTCGFTAFPTSSFNPVSTFFYLSTFSHWLVIFSLWDLFLQVVVFVRRTNWMNVINGLKWLETVHISPNSLVSVLALFPLAFYWYWLWVFLQGNFCGP